MNGRRIMLAAMGAALGLLIGGMITGTTVEEAIEQINSPQEIGESVASLSRSENELRRMAGVTQETGRGIKITLEDGTVRKGRNVPISRLIIHERDLLLMTNELFAAGAEAVSINGQRLVATSEIRCVGPAIRINGVNTVPPYIINAVGDPEVLKQTILMMGGVADYLSHENLRVDVETVEKLEVPAFRKMGAKND